ncbi:MAG: hypothetical protein ACKVS9_18590, partial [Phycisphaerae bacterium]
MAAINALERFEQSTRRCGVNARVSRVTHPCREHVAIDMELPDFPPSRPGQFLELLCTPGDDDPPVTLAWDDDRPFALPQAHWTEREAFVRRPFSIADRVETPSGSRLSVISRAIGPGTRFLDRVRVGDTLDVTGPLGQPFQIPDSPRPLLLVGGGVGIPPLLYLARDLGERGMHDATVIFGAMSADLMPVPLV